MQTSRVAGALGLSPRQARRAGRAASRAWVAGYGESIADANEAIVSIGQNVREIPALRRGELGRLIRGSLNLRQAFGPEVNEVTRVIGDYLRTGMVRSGSEAFDLLTIGFQRGANKSDELLDTLREYREPVQSLGLDMRDFMNIMVLGSRRGVYSVDRLGDALKEFSIKATDNSSATRQAYKDLRLDPAVIQRDLSAGGARARDALSTVIRALDEVGEARRNAGLGFALFGTMFEDVGWRAMRGLDPAVDALGRVEGSARRLDQTLGTGPAQNIERFKRGAKQLAVDVIGGDVIPALDALGRKTGRVAQGISDAGYATGLFLVDTYRTLRGVVLDILDWIADRTDEAIDAMNWANPFGDPIGHVPRPWAEQDGLERTAPMLRRMYDLDTWLKESQELKPRQRHRAPTRLPTPPVFPGLRGHTSAAGASVPRIGDHIAAAVERGVERGVGRAIGRRARSSRPMDATINVDRREIGRAAVRGLDDDDQWGADW
jgi:hypothetical protein